MKSSDAALLERYAQTHDAETFEELSRRYAGLVYGVCLRILRSPHDAEDVAQECFVQLARKAGTIESSLSGWLHTTATRRCLNVIRNVSTRERHEEQAMAESGDGSDPTWDELAPHVDKALDELPEKLRLPLVLYYLEGRGQSDLAGELGVDQSTVSRRLRKGVEALRRSLKKDGIIISGTVLGVLLSENAATAAPATLGGALGKMAIAGVGAGATDAVGSGATAASVAEAAGSFATIQTKVILVAAVVVFATAGTVTFGNLVRQRSAVPPAGGENTQPGGNGAMQEQEHGFRRNPMQQVDYSKVQLKGDGAVEDSFCLSVAEAARLLGRPVRYEDVLASLTNAFAPGFDTGNDCKELWVANAWVSYLGITPSACKRLGLEIEPIMHPDHPQVPSGPEYRADLLNRIRAAMCEGKVVITSGGWQHEKEWVEPWWAGIIVHASDDGTVVGAHPNGRSDCIVADIHSGELFAVSLLESPVQTQETITTLLRDIVRRIRARGKPGSYARDSYSAFGVDAMDEWINQMTDVRYFCPVCQEKNGMGWKSAEIVAQAMAHRSRIASEWLMQQGASFPDSARPHLEAAAGCYDRIVELLHPAITGEGGESYRQFIGEMASQQAHADTVLRPVKAELTAAANEIERALAIIEG